MEKTDPNPASDDGSPIPISQQAGISLLGEMVGIAASIGAVYTAEHLAPIQVRSLIDRLAGVLGRTHGTPAADHAATAGKIADFTIMNIGGLMNMGTQFTVHRLSQRIEDRAPMAQDLGRVLSGRVIGTATAGMALIATNQGFPRAMQRVEQRAGRLLGDHTRLGGLTVSSLVQSAGAIPGNMTAQLLYDNLINSGRNRA